MMRLARELQEGIEPRAPADPELFRVRPVHAMSGEPELQPIWEAYLREAIPQETPAS